MYDWLDAIENVSAVELVSRLVNKFSISDAVFDVGGGLGPAKGLRVLIPMSQSMIAASSRRTRSKLPQRMA
jgi:hypothetical protein